jgi:signal transduction histidine kinase
MINLIDNAIKFAPPGAAKRIDLGCTRQRDGVICFTVRDYGAGIPKDQMRRIFELFYRPQSELTRETVGTGIGLALVHQLTVAMAGRVDVQNREPGVEFSLTLPARGE